MATINLGRLGFIHRGNYDPLYNYTRLDVVFYPPNGSTYTFMPNTSMSNVLPTNTDVWQVLLSNQAVVEANAAADRANTAAIVATNAAALANQVVLTQVLIAPRGEYALNTLYNHLNLVTSNGSSYLYVSEISTISMPVTNTQYWMLIASKGADGADGLVLQDKKLYLTKSGDIISQGIDLTEVDGKTLDKVLIYYGYPSAINQTWTVGGATAVFAQYDLVVFGDTYNEPSQEDYPNFIAIIAQLRASKPLIKLVGYVPIGGTNGANRTIAEIQRGIDLWHNIGMNGIFLDEYGFDYMTTRERQNTCVSYVHGKNMFAFVNSWSDEYVFGGQNLTLSWIPGFFPNPNALAPLLNSNDYSLYENLFWNAYVNLALAGSVIWQIHRPYNYAYNPIPEYDGKSYRERFGTKIIALDGIHGAVPTADKKLMMTISIFAAKVMNIDGLGFGDEHWGSMGGIVQWDLPTYNLRESTTRGFSYEWKNIIEGGNATTIPSGYNAIINGESIRVIFDIDGSDDTEYTNTKRYVLIEGKTVYDAWDSLYAIRNSIDGFQVMVDTAVATIDGRADILETLYGSLGNLPTLTSQLGILKTQLETAITDGTQDIDNAIAGLALVVTGFQYTVREW